MEKFDLIVIGSGPGGYVAAIRAAQKGLRVACVEKEKTLGGTCLNVGCIPSKALLHSTEYYHRVAHEGNEHGIEASDLRVNLSKMMARKEKIVAGLVGGIDFLFKKNKVVAIKGAAKLTSSTTIEVEGESYEATHLLLATGSEPMTLPFLPIDEKRVLTSTGALALTEIPKKMLMIGAGVIGLELGSVYRRLGAEVEVIELLDRVTPGLDAEISKTVQQVLTKQGMIFHLNTKVLGAEVRDSGVTLKVDGRDFVGDVVLVAIGRKPYSEGLGLREVGIQTDESGRVLIDGSFRTSLPSVYAIGDLVDGPMLAHKASEEGIAAVDIICGQKAEINYVAIPNVMYTWPEVACVGMSEQEAKAAGIEIIVGKVPFRGIPRARCSGDEEGLVKIIGDKKSGRLIGMHIVGPSASEMIHEGVIALEKRAKVVDIAHASHAHPTCSEAIKEASQAALGEAIHL